MGVADGYRAFSGVQGEIWAARVRVAALASGQIWLARFLYIISLGHSHIPICLDIVSGYFQSIMAELCSGDRDGMAREAKNVYCLTLYRKCLSALIW